MPVLVPLKIYPNLTKIKSGDNHRKELYPKGGVYSFIFESTESKTMQYIGSSLNLYERMQDHLRGRDSPAKRSINKHGIDKFTFVIYYWHDDPLVILTDIETEVIKSFLFENLYNFKREAKNSLGYKHILEAIEKMKSRFKNRINHSMYGKNILAKHYLESVNQVYWTLCMVSIIPRKANKEYR